MWARILHGWRSQTAEEVPLLGRVDPIAAIDHLFITQDHIFSSETVRADVVEEVTNLHEKDKATRKRNAILGGLGITAAFFILIVSVVGAIADRNDCGLLSATSTSAASNDATSPSSEKRWFALQLAVSIISITWSLLGDLMQEGLGKWRRFSSVGIAALNALLVITGTYFACAPIAGAAAAFAFGGPAALLLWDATYDAPAKVLLPRHLHAKQLQTVFVCDPQLPNATHKAAGAAGAAGSQNATVPRVPFPLSNCAFLTLVLCAGHVNGTSPAGSVQSSSFPTLWRLCKNRCHFFLPGPGATLSVATSQPPPNTTFSLQEVPHLPCQRHSPEKEERGTDR
jgi:hypothetical protein